MPKKTSSKAAPKAPKARRARKTGAVLVTPAGLGKWLESTPCYAPKSAKSQRLVFNRDAFQQLCEANNLWNGPVWSQMPAGRLRMVGGIALRNHIKYGDGTLTSPFVN